MSETRCYNACSLPITSDAGGAWHCRLPYGHADACSPFPLASLTPAQADTLPTPATGAPPEFNVPDDGLTDWQRDCLKWRGKILTGARSHWCFEWDELPVDETCDEWPCGCVIGPDESKPTPPAGQPEPGAQG